MPRNVLDFYETDFIRPVQIRGELLRNLNQETVVDASSERINGFFDIHAINIVVITKLFAVITLMKY